MLIAHLPASYLWGRVLGARGARSPLPGASRLPPHPPPPGLTLQRHLQAQLLLLGLLASVLPDLDLLYFYFVDGRAHPHHTYWTHRPVVWALLASLAAVLVIWERRLRDPVLVFFSNILLHLALDTVAGGICWLYPLSDRSVQLVSVPAVHGHWLLSFVHHWSFLLELGIGVAALAVWGRDRAAVARARGADPAPRSRIRSSTDLSIFKIAHR